MNTTNKLAEALTLGLECAYELLAEKRQALAGHPEKVAPYQEMADYLRRELAAHEQAQAAPLKERPDFIAGYYAGLADGRRCAERDAAEQAQAGDRAMASDWSWTGVRMELEASGRDDLSAWVSQQIEPKAHAGEPVVPYLYVYEYDSPFGLNREFYPSGWNGQKPTRTVPLYTTPQPAQAERVGLTDEQIAEGRYRTWAAEPEDAPEAWSFLRGARWAESALAVRWGVKLGATTGKEPGNV